MPIGRLSDDAIQRVSGPAWAPLRQAFLDMSERLLDVAGDAVGLLTTIYVKYQTSSTPNSPVFAVAWLKNSRQIVLGLALPEGFSSEALGPAPAGMKYKGITKYLTVLPGDTLPSELPDWAKAAYAHAANEKSEW